MIIAVVVVTTVACAIVPRRARFSPASGFPWFWAVFPAACFAVAGAVGVFAAWPDAIGGWWSFTWNLFPPRSPYAQFLSNEQFNQMVALHRLRQWLGWLLPVAGGAGIGLSVWAWCRRRV